MRLTQRDLHLLAFLSAQGVATADQLTDKFFPSRILCQGRLHQLMRAGLVESLPLTTLKSISFSCYKQAIEMFSISRKDGWKYRIYRLTEVLRKHRTSTQKFSEPKLWKHQLQLNGIRTLFEGWFPKAVILTDPEVQLEERRFKKWASGHPYLILS